jgi:hypothetical protein
MIPLNETRRTMRWSLAVLTALALGPYSVPALAQSEKTTTQVVNLRHFRADASAEAYRRFVPVNGAQIMGGFGSPGDLIDNETGEIHHR